MKFQTPEFKPGLNMTVRRGIKTYQEVEQLTDVQGNPIGWANIGTTQIMRFCDIYPEEIQMYHHLKSVREWDGGLILEMYLYYTKFIREEIVTVVYFEVINETGQ